MSIYNYHPHIDDEPIRHHMDNGSKFQKPDLTNLIHPYNKVCFKNYDEAVSILKSKDLQPGEIALAYYFDRTNAYGINVIAAVGSLKVNSANIIFNSANTIENSITSLKTTVEINNEKVESYDDIINTTKENNKVVEGLSEINSISNTSVNNIETTIADIQESLTETETQISQINSFIDNQTNVNNEVSNSQQLTSQLIDDLEKKFNSSLVEYVDSITNLKSEITKQINTDLLPIKTDIYDINRNIDTLGKSIDSMKSDLTSYIKDYVPVAIETKLLNVNNSIDKLSANIDNCEDNIQDVSRYYSQLINNLHNYIKNNNTTITDIVNTSLNSMSIELSRQKKYLSDSINAFKNECDVNTDSKISTASLKLQDNINKLSSKEESDKSSLLAKISTINTTFDSYKTEVSETMSLLNTENLTNMRNYLNTLIANDRIYYDSIFARKDEIDNLLTAGSGIVINNGVISLNIDNNGLLMFNGKRYLLQEL